VDYGEGPMVRDPNSGKYRRMRMFVMTLGHSRKSVRLLVSRSSTQTWAELHEKAFRRLGGATHRIKEEEDRPSKTPLSTRLLLSRCQKAGQHIGAFCHGLHRNHGEVAVRRILGVLSLAKKYGVASAEDAWRRSPGNGRDRIPLRAPLPGAQSATVAATSPGRSAHPPAHALARYHQKPAPSKTQPLSKRRTNESD
jgi:hypothetical protein